LREAMLDSGGGKKGGSEEKGEKKTTAKTSGKRKVKTPSLSLRKKRGGKR